MHCFKALAYTFKRDLRYYFENKSILEWYDNLHIMMSCLYIKQTEVNMLNLKIITKDASKKFSKRLCMCFYFFYLTLQQVTRLIKNFSKQQTFWFNFINDFVGHISNNWQTYYRFLFIAPVESKCVEKGGKCQENSKPCDNYQTGLCIGGKNWQCCISNEGFVFLK